MFTSSTGEAKQEAEPELEDKTSLTNVWTRVTLLNEMCSLKVSGRSLRVWVSV